MTANSAAAPCARHDRRPQPREIERFSSPGPVGQAAASPTRTESREPSTRATLDRSYARGALIEVGVGREDAGRHP
jgi:hypothetical protein